MQGNELLTTKEAAMELKVSERWITKQIQDGKLQAIQLNKGYRIYRTELNRFIRDRQTERRDE